MSVIYTARVTYSGPGKVDVSRKSAESWATAFAPSWNILRPALASRRESESLLRICTSATDREAYQIESDAWERYVPAFMAEMRTSYRNRRADWDRLLSMQEATLCCYCNRVADEHCHRFLLAKILESLGATYAGERR